LAAAELPGLLVLPFERNSTPILPDTKVRLEAGAGR
jgi:hypothetical protein